MTIRILATAGALALGLAGCSTSAPLPIPEARSFANEPAPAGEGSSLDLSQSVATFGLAKVVAQLPRGKPVIAFPTSGLETEGIYCNYRRASQKPYLWGGGKRLIGDWESTLGLIVFEVLDAEGYNMAGDPSNLFDERKALASADYLIGARIIDLRGNFCHVHSWWDGVPLYVYSGDMYMEVEWSIQDNLARDVVFKSKTIGNFRQNETIPDGIQVAFDGAFEDATDRFANMARVKRLALGEPLDGSAASLADATAPQRRVVANGKEASGFDIQTIGPSVVTVRAGTSHGSGFFIGKRGLAITNAHVVGEARRVRLITTSGLEIDAEVVARDERRDVALLQSTIKVAKPLAIRTALPNVAEDVFAIGSPLFEELRTTVTKGVVSAIRKEERSGNLIIQSDASISPGNSGGPLVDEAGRVVGISVARYTINDAQGLGLFIPIGEALEKLGIVLESNQAGS